MTMEELLLVVQKYSRQSFNALLILKTVVAACKFNGNIGRKCSIRGVVCVWAGTEKARK